MFRTDIIGRLGSDPVMNTTPNGKQVTNFSVAVDDGYGENKKTVWIRVSCWDKQAEVAAKYLAKGRQVYLEGRVRSGHYNDKNSGEVIDTLEMNAYRLELLGSKAENEGGNGGNGGGYGSTASEPVEDVDFDSLPF